MTRFRAALRLDSSPLLLRSASPSVALASSRIVADDVLARASAAAVHGRVVAVESSWDPARGHHLYLRHARRAAVVAAARLAVADRREAAGRRGQRHRVRGRRTGPLRGGRRSAAVPRRAAARSHVVGGRTGAAASGRSPGPPMRRRRWRARCAAPIPAASCRATSRRWRSCRRWPRSPAAARRRPASSHAARRAPRTSGRGGAAFTLLTPAHAGALARGGFRRAGLRRHRRAAATRSSRGGGLDPAGPGGPDVGHGRFAAAAARRVARAALLQQQRAVGRPHLADLRRSLRRDRRRELDAGDRRRLLLVERHPQRQRRELLEDHQGR